jgi:hypothetical protein
MTLTGLKSSRGLGHLQRGGSVVRARMFAILCLSLAATPIPGQSPVAPLPVDSVAATCLREVCELRIIPRWYGIPRVMIGYRSSASLGMTGAVVSRRVAGLPDALAEARRGERYMRRGHVVLAASLVAGFAIVQTDRRGTQELIDYGWRTYAVPFTFIVGLGSARVLYGRGTTAFERAAWLHNAVRVR